MISKLLIGLVLFGSSVQAAASAKVCEGIFIDPVRIKERRMHWYFSIYRDRNWDPKPHDIHVFLKDQGREVFHASLPENSLAPQGKSKTALRYKATRVPAAGDFIQEIRVKRFANHTNVTVIAFGDNLTGGSPEKSIAFQVGDENFSLKHDQWRKTQKGWSMTKLGDVDESFCEPEKPLLDDPARIRLFTDKLDRFELFAGLGVDGELNIDRDFSLKLENEAGELIDAKIPLDQIIVEQRRGKKAYKYLNRDAKDLGGISELRIHPHDAISYSIRVKYFGDLEEATTSQMRVEVEAGDRFFNEASWLGRYDGDDLFGWVLTKFMK